MISVIKLREILWGLWGDEKLTEKDTSGQSSRLTERFLKPMKNKQNEMRFPGVLTYCLFIDDKNIWAIYGAITKVICVAISKLDML